MKQNQGSAKFCFIFGGLGIKLSPGENQGDPLRGAGGRRPARPPVFSVREACSLFTLQ